MAPKLFLLSLLYSVFLFSPVVFGQDIITELRRHGCGEFAGLLQRYPSLLSTINGRNDVTVFAPRNEAVRAAASQGKLERRQGEGDSGGGQYQAGVQGKTNEPPIPDKARKRQEDFPDSNIEAFNTLVDDPSVVNLGTNSDNQRRPLRLIQNQAAPPDGNPLNGSVLEIESGLGKVVKTLRGPFKYNKGIIYEVEDFFELPHSFTQTFYNITIAQKFFDAICASQKTSFFENTPALTIFAPVDSSYSGNCTANPDDHVIQHFAGLSPDLLPGRKYKTVSGKVIEVSWAPDGGRLINGRHLLKSNVVTKNGVVHFIDGPLDGTKSSPTPSSHTPPAPSVGYMTGAAPTVTTGAGALIAAIGAVLMLVA